MTREEKQNAIEDLTQQLADTGIFYIADTSELDAQATSDLRRECFKNDIKISVVKNTVLRKAMEKVEGKDLEDEGVVAVPLVLMVFIVGNGCCQTFVGVTELNNN